MLKLMQKKLNKKGFTLAELLIVVAIIAILIAIAMPLFFGALDEAKEQTWNANARALRAIGVAEILTDPGTYQVGTAEGWNVKGTPTGTGDFSGVKITIGTGDESSYDSSKSTNTEISVNITKTSITGP